MATLIESAGGISLYSNSDGTWTVQQGNVSTPIQDICNMGPTHLTNIAAVGYYNGAQIVVFHGGPYVKYYFWYCSNWQNMSDPPTGNQVVIQLTGIPVAIDASIFNAASFNTAFGAGSLS